MCILFAISFLGFVYIVQSLHVQVQSGHFSEEMDFTLNSSIRYVLVFQPPQETLNPYRINAWTTNTNYTFAVLVQVDLKENSMSWTVPLVFPTSNKTHPTSISHGNTSRILCDNKFSQNKSEKNQNFTVTLSTSSLMNLHLVLEVVKDETFYIKKDVNYTVLVSASQPQYFFYKFDSTENGTIIVEIDSSDDICLTASIQENHCPVFDLDKDINSYSGFEYHTIMTKGGMTINRQDFPDGFFLVFVAKVDDYLCNTRLGPFSDPSPRLTQNRLSTVNFLISKGRNDEDYKAAFWKVGAIFVGFYVIVITIISTFFYWGHNSYHPLIEDSGDTEAIDEETTEESVLIRISPRARGVPNTVATDEERTSEASVPIPTSSTSVTDAVARDEERTSEESVLILTNSTSVADIVATDEERNSVHQLTSIRPRPTVADLAKNPELIFQRLYLYFKYTVYSGIFYIIPVIQLMFTYQQVLNATGNTDLCYYNFRCANPAWFLSDVNSVYSNIGYLLMGILFLGVVAHRQWYLPPRETGIRVHYGIFYALGTALINEGVLSACYHICPDGSHFQFDTSFMYVMAVLCMVQIYQKRHSDIVPTACSTFFALAMIIVLAMVGLIDWTHGYMSRLILGCFLGIVYCILCSYISLKVYYFGTVLTRLKQLFGQCNSSIYEVMKPREKARFIVVVIANVINYTMLGAVLSLYITDALDFGTLLLILLLIANVLLYAMTYTIMKYIYGERIGLQTIIFGLGALACWSAALVFFLRNVNKTNLSPAQSRFWNQPCIFLQFYDSHDVWHLLSASSLFLTFMYLLCVDDDIIYKNREDIPVF